MKVRTRFAPSPTGRLHLGNLRTAVLCWLYARQQDGQFLLRLDDTDAARSSERHADAIKEDLDWLGLHYDEHFRQSERLQRYEKVFEKLVRDGHIYACYETPQELAQKRQQQLARGRPPLYDRAGLRLTDQAKANYEQEGRTPHWRLKLSGGLAQWDDMVRGAQRVATANLSDPVLRRADGGFLYTLPSAVDDMDKEISHVIRGEDHVTNTAVQLELFRLLGAAPPCFAHHTLLVEADGSALSKRGGAQRDNARSVAALREAGYQPQTLRAYLAQLGVSGTGTEKLQLEKLGRSALRFSEPDLKRLNARILRATDYKTIAPRLRELGCDGGEAFWLAVRGNISLLSEAQAFCAMLRPPAEWDGAPEIAAADKDFLAQAADLLPPEPWDDGSWQVWMEALAPASQRKGKALYQPLRLALTGLAQGPEMRALLPLLGRARVQARLRGGKR